MARTIERSPTELVIRRTLHAPRELVFDAFTVPAHVAKWWGPRGFTAFSCEFDAQPGGTWRVGMRSPDGQVLWTRGTYLEVVRPSRLVLSFDWEEPSDGLAGETLVTIDLADRGHETELVLRHAGFTALDIRDRHEGGWTESLDRFAEHLELEVERRADT